MSGVPASDIKATFLPSNKCWLISSFLLNSLPKKNDFNGVSMEKLFVNFDALRVSSQYIKSTNFKVSTIRFDVSSKFPIGVGQI